MKIFIRIIMMSWCWSLPSTVQSFISSHKRQPFFIYHRHNTYSTLYSSLSSTQYRELYPQKQVRNGTVVTADGHYTIAYQIYGRSEDDAPKAVFLHGGPGAGCFPRHAGFFDPDFYQIILFDQRGCGRSQPTQQGCNNSILINQTLNYLVQDIELLRNELNVIDKWLVLGGSWGATLAVAYAQRYPKHVAGLILRGVCLMRQKEVDWFCSSTSQGSSAALQNPHAWARFAAINNSTALQELNEPNVTFVDDTHDAHPSKVQANGRSVLYEYYNWMLGGTREQRLFASKLWWEWEASMSRHKDKIDLKNDFGVNNETVFVKESGSSASWRVNYASSVDVHDVNFDVSTIVESLKKYKQENIHSNESSDTIIDNLDIVYSSSYQHQRPELNDNVKVFPVQKPQIKLIMKNELSEQQKSYVPIQPILTCYYSVHNGFTNGSLLRMDRVCNLKDIPIIAIHGGLDNICPVDTAIELAEALPQNVELRIPLNAGHSMYDPMIKHELLEATDRMKYLFCASFSEEAFDEASTSKFVGLEPSGVKKI